MRCPACGNENRGGRKFCSRCGAPLALTCPACGAGNEAEDRFCGECGSALTLTVPPDTVAAEPSGREAQVAERRLVSVLFADLVGFTPLSERRDAEEVRELLSRYFETARRLIELYGGSLEKFIGDAVMAVWGAPVAQEDDAERAVRAALDLTAAVSALGAEIGAPDLALRAGVATGETAVTLGAEGQGMVAGDLVNTASRVQSAAASGAVLVTDATRHATEASIAYEDAGAHELKGKAEPIHLSRAMRVVAGRGGSLRSSGLESPFVGRDRELRLIKELFHASAEQGKAHLVSVTGIAGIGKSRLSWEFFKYIDGLIDEVWWHRGRCIAYGEGVTYWALAEMVRMRARILEEEAPASAVEKLRRSIQDIVADPEERRWIEPRLAHLLGLEERTAPEREDLFAAWRLFFERMAELNPLVLVFEDLQWADTALLDFIEYLLDWSRNHPLFVLSLIRPELAERRPSWGTGKHGFTSLPLEPLSADAMDGLLRGMVPGLPDDLLARIRDRAEGIPLYAVETVRMLLDRGLLKREGSRFELTGAVVELEVPETLQALIAARLDGLSPKGRALLQDASVLGKTFTRPALSAVTGLPEAEFETLLASLVHKELLTVQADPRSPELGQYGFLQSLVQKVAYDTLSRKDRKARHVAVAEYIETHWGSEEDEIVEVLAAHYLEAYRLAPDAPDSGEIRRTARETLVRAGRRAESLAATEQAQGYFERASDLADDDLQRAELAELADIMARNGGRSEQAMAHFEEATALFEQHGETHPAARVSARIGEVLWDQDRIEEAIDRMEASFSVLADEEPDEDLATLAAQLARILFFKGELDAAAERVDLALEIAESLWLPEVLSQALNTKSLIIGTRGRLEEGFALLKHALEIAVENDVPTAALRAYVNLSNDMSEQDRYDDALGYQLAGIALARKFGIRGYEWFLLGHLAANRLFTGHWDEAFARAAEIPSPEEVPDARTGSQVASYPLIDIHVNRGSIDEASRLFELWAGLQESGDVQTRASHAAINAVLLRAQGKPAEALRSAQLAVDSRAALSPSHPSVKYGFVQAVEAALELGEAATADELLRIYEAERPARVPPFLKAHLARFRARLSAGQSHAELAESGFKAAAGLFRELGLPFYLAVTQLEHGEWLMSEGRTDEAELLTQEARSTFELLGARPWLERLARSEPRNGPPRAETPGTLSG